ncbi:lipid-A-disaccharide synthase [Candidatus Aerophobetes bacterium]|uniref:Lipid-A-disaccharide synthase n=1 Tax=Aerophobetes bacterium TaxID=2030807 RepID=A0A2A4YMY2_UNCAE|nr:MAG: lipid-A-disaccharide synthase [Candidatus Aerophobetes bacterium]
MKTCDIFVFAGEASGDHLGSELIRALLSKNKNLKISGVLGPLMREENASSLLEMEEFQVMGFIDVVKALPKLFKLFKKTRELIINAQPKALVLIDYPGFNLRMAKSLKKRGFKAPIIQYVCPSVWAWKSGRIKTMEKFLDHLICLFPFEPSCFAKTKLEATFIGHPLAKKIKEYQYKENLFNFKKPVLSIFPGSRKNEIERNLPLMFEMAKKHTKGMYDIAVSCASKNRIPLITSIIKNDATLISSCHNYELMKASSFAFAVSGTITLELALHKLPSIVTYAIRPFDFFLARKIFRIDLPHYCIANYTASVRMFPEFYGPHFNKEMLNETLSFMLENEEELSLCKRRCENLQKIFEKKEPNQLSAKVILEKALQ